MNSAYPMDVSKSLMDCNTLWKVRDANRTHRGHPGSHGGDVVLPLSIGSALPIFIHAPHRGSASARTCRQGEQRLSRWSSFCTEAAIAPMISACEPSSTTWLWRRGFRGCSPRDRIHRYRKRRLGAGGKPCEERPRRDHRGARHHFTQRHPGAWRRPGLGGTATRRLGLSRPICGGRATAEEGQQAVAMRARSRRLRSPPASRGGPGARTRARSLRGPWPQDARGVYRALREETPRRLAGHLSTVHSRERDIES